LTNLKEELQGREVRSNSDLVTSEAQARELEENQTTLGIEPNTQNMTREELIRALVRARAELARERRFGRGRTGRDPVTSSASLDLLPTQTNSRIRRFFSTLSNGTSSSNVTAPPAYDDLV
jgi:hypothetical protein